MDGVLEQILSELKDIKQLLAKTNQSTPETGNQHLANDTMRTKEAAQYLGITQHRLLPFIKAWTIRHLKAGIRFLL